ncbi:hypothetical protein COU20_02095 [Candidatus Kaiserbacteria bacterium CG10_big_fil_rev_8_21_14_0_10_59_10]|uniref:DUF192 domain-containing protein n=1 Tax=Candidatus Kaiserbacteria bacterium CG10_big_fil_rev_8_21_14_0_10_59_10 TaxID=1974612 RepID=A0A2H0U9M7_9BACT|nr:MAG: hypothetical protein COU20_02095 [Candidatus Kaiserbacteria bacterium CG10_big_fil_rev_8_21_14_0_10_59_10]
MAIAKGMAAAAILAAAAFVLIYSMQQRQFEEHRVPMRIGGVPILVSIVETPDERARGLSGRESLAPDEGMLFIFPEDGYYSIWMKDMLFSIDILWLSAEGEVVDMRRDVAPETYPAGFSPHMPARFVLELPAGFSERNGIEIGSMAELP